MIVCLALRYSPSWAPADDIKDWKHRKKHTPSPVVTIDDVPAAEYLQQLSLFTTGTHDPDARFNLLFPNLIKDTNTLYPSSGSPEYRGAPFLPDATTVRLQNKTTLTFPNLAFLRADFSNITTANSTYAEWGPASPHTDPWAVLPWSAHEVLAKNFTRSFAGYPPPHTVSDNGQLAGFLPPSRALSDVAVLDVRSFSLAPSPYNFLEFDRGYEARFSASVALIRAARAADRKKLIIDLQGNGGGQYINLAALYVTLFPGLSIPLLWRHRAHPLLAALVEEADHLVAEGASRSDVVKLFPFNVDRYLRPNGTAWESFAEWYGAGVGGATRPSLYNLSTALFPGPEYRHRQPWEEAPYRAEDIVILLDGICASACAIFVEALVHGHGVRTVAVGGRPIEAPMQGVGQVKQGALLAFPVYVRALFGVVMVMVVLTLCVFLAWATWRELDAAGRAGAPGDGPGVTDTHACGQRGQHGAGRRPGRLASRDDIRGSELQAVLLVRVHGRRREALGASGRGDLEKGKKCSWLDITEGFTHGRGAGVHSCRRGSVQTEGGCRFDLTWPSDALLSSPCVLSIANVFVSIVFSRLHILINSIPVIYIYHMSFPCFLGARP